MILGWGTRLGNRSISLQVCLLFLWHLVLPFPFYTEFSGLIISQKNIRECIPRWTASKYRTAPIKKIVEEMQTLLTGSVSGITVFNSNLNFRNKRSVNDQYILLISQEHRIFVDINRKTTISFTPEE